MSARNPTKAQREAEKARVAASLKAYPSDALAWQLALPVNSEGKPATDTTVARNRRFARMDNPTGIMRVTGGCGVVHGPYRPNINRHTYEARRVATCTNRVYDTREGNEVISAQDVAARKAARKPAWAKW